MAALGYLFARERGGCYSEPTGHKVDHRGNFRVGIAAAKSRHQFLSQRGLNVRALQERLRCIGAGWIIDCSRAEERRIFGDGAASVEAVAADAGALKNAQAKRASARVGPHFLGRLRLPNGRLCHGKLAARGSRRNAPQIGRHGTNVILGQEAEAIVDNLGHGTARRAPPVGVTMGKIALELRLGPLTDAPFRVGRDVVRLPALNERACEFLPGLQPKQDVSRRMAVSAMAERLDEIGSSIPFSRLIGVGLKAVPGLEQHVPKGHQVALIEGECHVVGRRRVFDRLEAEQIGLDGERVVARHQGVGGIRKGRIEMLSPLANTVVQYPDEFVIAPRADARVLVWGNVGRIDRADHGEFESEAPRKRLAARHRMAGNAVGRAGEIFAASHGISLREACRNTGRVRSLKICKVHALAARESRGIAAAQ